MSVFTKNGKINKNPVKPDERSVRISESEQQIGDRIHDIDATSFCNGMLVLESEDKEQLYEAVLMAENFLSYNGSWDFARNMYENGNSHICELSFKWNGFLSTMDSIISQIKLPSGVKKEFRFDYDEIKK